MNKYTKIFNAMLAGNQVSFQDDLLPLVSEFLTDNNSEKAGEMINLIVQNPVLIQQAMPTIIRHFCIKYDIIYIMFNDRIIYYYENSTSDVS